MSGQLKIVLLGATGQTGQPLLRKCLERGHLVVAVIRTATSLAVEHENLRIEVADIFSSESLTPIFRGQDLVISALGFPKQLDEKIREYRERQMLRFGNIVDLDSLEVSGPSQVVLDL